MKILVVDDDLELLPLVAFAMRQAGYVVLEAADGETALEQVARELPDLVVLDVNLPGIDGFEVCRRIRASSEVPILMLTVRGDESDLVRGLDLGADDYLTKPFSPRTLLARVRALMRRAGSVASARTEVGRFSIDLERATVTIGGGEPVSLTPLELRALLLLMAHAGHTVASTRLLRQLWGGQASADREHLKQVIYRLRQKVEPEPGSPRFLHTDAGVGYRLDPG